MVFTLAEPCSAPDHLTVQRSDLRRSEHDHAVNGRAVPALGEQHGIAEHIVLAFIKVGENFCAVIGIAVDLCCAESGIVQDVAKLLRGLDQR